MKLLIFGRPAQIEPKALEEQLRSIRPDVQISGSSLLSVTEGAVDPRSSSGSGGREEDLFPDGAPSYLLSWWLSGIDRSESADVRAALASVASGALVLDVEEHVAIDGQIPEGGTCRLALLNRVAGQTREAFWDHWRNRHVPLVISKEPLFVRYVGNHPRSHDVALDAVVEQWFPSEAALQEHDRQVFETKEEVRNDLPNFLGRMRQFLGTVAEP